MCMRLHASAWLLPIAAAIAACTSTVEPVPNATLLRGIDWVVDGVSTVGDVEARLGEPHARYERGSVHTYPLVLRRGQLERAEEEPDHVLVLVFGEDGVLERHSLVRRR